MADITMIPLGGLHDDLLASEQDIAICRRALAIGVDKYDGGRKSTKRRLEINKKIVQAIKSELVRREEAHRHAQAGAEQP